MKARPPRPSIYVRVRSESCLISCRAHALAIGPLRRSILTSYTFTVWSWNGCRRSFSPSQTMIPEFPEFASAPQQLFPNPYFLLYWHYETRISSLLYCIRAKHGASQPWFVRNGEGQLDGIARNKRETTIEPRFLL